MYCEKQGLAHFVSCVYTQKYSVTDDFSRMPRPCHNLVIILKGNVIFSEDGMNVHVHENEMAFIPKGSRYSAQWFPDPDMVFHTLHFDFEWHNDPLKNKKIPVQKIATDNIEELKKQFTYLHNNQNAGTFEFNSVFYAICSKSVAKLEHAQITHVSQIQPALDYMENHYTERITVEYLATLCCISESRFYVCFRDETGMTPIEYKNRLCIRHTMHALISEPTKSAEKIALENGFDSVVYFRRMFKRYTGKTPGDYRNEGVLM